MLFGAGGAVFLAKLIHASCGINHLLLARIKRVTGRTNFNLQVVTQCRPSFEDVAARARDRDLPVVRVSRGFHGARESTGNTLLSQASKKVFLYPQKLWITLWIARAGGTPFPRKSAYLLSWLKNDQAFFT